MPLDSRDATLRPCSLPCPSRHERLGGVNAPSRGHEGWSARLPNPPHACTCAQSILTINSQLSVRFWLIVIPARKRSPACSASWDDRAVLRCICRCACCWQREAVGDAPFLVRCRVPRNHAGPLGVRVAGTGVSTPKSTSLRKRDLSISMSVRFAISSTAASVVRWPSKRCSTSSSFLGRRAALLLSVYSVLFCVFAVYIGHALLTDVGPALLRTYPSALVRLRGAVEQRPIACRPILAAALSVLWRTLVAYALLRFVYRSIARPIGQLASTARGWIVRHRRRRTVLGRRHFRKTRSDTCVDRAAFVVERPLQARLVRPLMQATDIGTDHLEA